MLWHWGAYQLSEFGIFFLGVFHKILANCFNTILIIASLTLLLGASDIVLECAVKISEALVFWQLVIGLTIVSLGTSIPEMFTAIASAKEGVGAFVVGRYLWLLYYTTVPVFRDCGAL